MFEKYEDDFANNSTCFRTDGDYERILFGMEAVFNQSAKLKVLNKMTTLR